jgi:hypothetical protein
MGTLAKLAKRCGLFALLVFVTAAPAGAGSLAIPELVSHAPIQVLRDREGHQVRGRRHQSISMNWSGYETASFQTGLTYTSASGTWTVPFVSFTSGFRVEFSAEWVGIGGFCTDSMCHVADHSLIQLGTEQDVRSDGATQYFAWYELLPHLPKVVPLAISPGDVIIASVQCTGKCDKKRQTWTLTMTDSKTGKNFTKIVHYKSQELSADWIEEAPTGKKILPLADFDKATLDPDSANGTSPSLTPEEAVEMTDPQGQTSNPSSPDSESDGFSACWNSGKVLISCQSPAS